MSPDSEQAGVAAASVFFKSEHKETGGRSMPNVTAFQKADRLALLIAIDSFFALLENREMSEDASRVAFKIRRCEYEGKPADVKT